MMVKFQRLGICFFAVVAVLLSGCGHQYTFNNNSYSSPDSALGAHREYLKEIERDIESVSSIPRGNAVIITPSKNTCEALGITRKGHPTEDMINYLGQYLEEDYAFFSNFLVKSNIFSSVEHVINDYPLQYANKVKSNYSATIYLDMKSPSQISWFILIAPENLPVQLHFDKMADNGAPKIISWINDIKNHFHGDK
jgi:hypothetical protein